MRAARAAHTPVDKTAVCLTAGLFRRLTQIRRSALDPLGASRRWWLVDYSWLPVVTPYNDYVLQNTPLIGNHFPIGVFLLIAFFVLVVNPVLQAKRFGRRRAGDGRAGDHRLPCCWWPPPRAPGGLIRYLESGLIGPLRVLDGMPWF